MRNHFSFSIFFTIHLLTHLVGHGMTPSFLAFAADTNKVYIIYLGERQHNDPKLVMDSHYDMLTDLMDSKELALESMVYSYRHGFSGFAAKLTEVQAQQLSEHPDVVAVMPNTFYKLQTTRSWDYLGLSPQTPDNIPSKTNMGDGVIIGVLDTGIWPESKSFNDEGVGPIPSGWKGSCKSGDQFNPSKHCNRKLIGARWFVDGFLASIGRAVNLTALGEFVSARDAEGHGTHVSSTAAGASVANVSYHGVGLGTARGGAPHARLAMYKVCWKVPRGSCASADILKAFDEAIKDGVHVLTLSIAASSLPLYSEVDGRDAIAIGSFHAVKNGITVVCGAGNDGSSPQNVKNFAPWIITVGATSMDRAFPTPIFLGNNKTFLGESIYRGKTGKLTELVYRTPNDTYSGLCEDLFFVPTNHFAGKIVLCFTTFSTPSVTSFAAVAARSGGGVGVIVSKLSAGITGQCGSVPCAEVDFQIGTQILYYIRNAKNPMARIDPPSTLVGKLVSAKVAEFSSRGPNSVAPSILKPDISAPGVQIIAATSGVDTTAEQGFTMLSGTSMSTPHIAAVVALVRSQHPTWSPAAVKSAIVTTAWTTNTYGIPIYAEGSSNKLADPFDFGAGIANPNEAARPGLIYDMGYKDYVDYLCAMEYKESDISKLTGQTVVCPASKANALLDLNLPSITIPNLRHSIVVTRTVTNVGPTDSVYRVIVEPPVGTHVFVYPPVLMFNCMTKTLSFKVTVTSLMQQFDSEYYFGSLVWTDGVHHVRSPISVRTAVMPDDFRAATI